MIDLSAVKDYKVLVVGDGIIDEYFYVKPIGKSIKESNISTLYESRESFFGGAWAGHRHVQNFCPDAHVMTGHSVMANWRFLEKVYMHKLFTVHEKRDNSAHASYPIGDYDLVIVTDFGHGFVDASLIDRLTTEAKYLAVNAQTNSTNFGFNLITKFPRADFVVVDELEARLAAHDRDSPIEDVILKLGFKHIIVTLGKNGAIGYDGFFHHAPAVAKDIIDTMGAGDAFLCVTAPFAKAGYSMPDLLRIGNAAGAAKVAIVGHEHSVTPEMVMEYL